MEVALLPPGRLEFPGAKASADAEPDGGAWALADGVCAARRAALPCSALTTSNRPVINPADFSYLDGSRCVPLRAVPTVPAPMVPKAQAAMRPFREMPFCL